VIAGEHDAAAVADARAEFSPRGNPSAVVIGGGAIAMPVARSLGAAGVPVIALGGSVDPIRFSRFCNRFVDVGAGNESQPRALEWLLEHAPAGAVVIPCSDHGLELVVRHRDVLTERTLRPLEGNDRATLAMRGASAWRCRAP
jgi:hypothetical protein